MAIIPVYDGEVGEATVHIEDTVVVRFTSIRSGKHGTAFCWHIDDPKAAKKLRKLLKPLADRA